MARPSLFFQRTLLLVLFISVFGAGTVDVLCTDVIPLRPYTTFFVTEFQPLRALASHGLIGDLFGALLIVVMGSAMFGTIANLTTGRTIAHAGFTVNPNLTSSIELVPVIQLIPFLFGGLVALGAYSVLERTLPGGL